MGSLLCEKLKKAALPGVELYAIGTNSTATAAMLKAGADYGATGENPVLVACRDADYIIGPLGILAADSLLGEDTSSMAVAVGRSKARKILLPSIAATSMWWACRIIPWRSWRNRQSQICFLLFRKPDPLPSQLLPVGK